MAVRFKKKRDAFCSKSQQSGSINDVLFQSSKRKHRARDKEPTSGRASTGLRPKKVRAAPPPFWVFLFNQRKRPDRWVHPQIEYRVCMYIPEIEKLFLVLSTASPGEERDPCTSLPPPFSFSFGVNQRNPQDRGLRPPHKSNTYLQSKSFS